MKRNLLLLSMFCALAICSLMGGCADAKTEEEKKTIENAGKVSTPRPGMENAKGGVQPPPP